MGSQPDIPLQYVSDLEPAPQNFPEVSHRESRAPELAYYYNQDPYHPHNHHHQYPHNQHHHHLYPPQTYQSYLPKPDDPYSSNVPLAGIAGSPYPFSPASQTAVLSQSGATTTNYKDHQKILGCSRVVFLLSCAIAILFAAVIGLAAATGVENIRANDSEKRAASLSASLASAEAAVAAAGPTATVTVTVDSNPSATSFPVLTNGCSDDPEGTTGTNYTTFKLLGPDKLSQRFTMACNKDTIYDPLLSLFVPNFQTCMDACSGYSKYVPDMFEQQNENSTCGAVSFIPLWTVKEKADAGGAPGNCYLKRGPMGLDDLKPANIGTECHSAVLVEDRVDDGG